MAIPILGEIERFITEHGSSVVLKERLTLLQDKLVLLNEEVEKLERENYALKNQVVELQRQLAAESCLAEFVEERGALFKRRVGGGFHQAVYCPECRQSASPFPPGAEFNCKCGWFSSFTEGELAGVMSRLPT